jgi:hypothetical protein
VQIAITGTRGDYWISKGSQQYGPFNTVLDASWVAIDMVTDAANAVPGMNVLFFSPEVSK